MDLEEKFKEETGRKSYVYNDLRPKVYSDSYVEWLEERLCASESSIGVLDEHRVMDLLPELKEGEAESLARCSTYAFDAAEKDVNPINWGDAEMFFLEGYNYARRILKGNKP